MEDFHNFRTQATKYCFNVTQTLRKENYERFRLWQDLKQISKLERITIQTPVVDLFWLKLDVLDSLNSLDNLPKRRLLKYEYFPEKFFRSWDGSFSSSVYKTSFLFLLFTFTVFNCVFIIFLRTSSLWLVPKQLQWLLLSSIHMSWSKLLTQYLNWGKGPRLCIFIT